MYSWFNSMHTLVYGRRACPTLEQLLVWKINKCMWYEIGVCKMDSEIIQETQAPNLPLTQDTVKKKSVIQYAWALLFHFDINNNNPFTMVRLRDFAHCNFPWGGIKGEMTREFRIKLHTFSTIPDKQFYVFAKIQYGKMY